MSARPDPRWKWLDKTIKRHGLALIGVNTELWMDPVFVYTAGFADRGLPELIVYGLGSHVGSSVLNAVDARTRRDGLVPTAGGEVGGLLGGRGELGVHFGAVHPVHARGLVTSTVAAFRDSEDAPPVLQVIVPDTAGRFPGDPGADPMLTAVQPDLSRMPSWPEPLRHPAGPDGAVEVLAARHYGHGGVDRWEALPAVPTDEDAPDGSGPLLRIACVPYLVTDVGGGDVVRVEPSDDGPRVVEVVRSASHVRSVIRTGRKVRDHDDAAAAIDRALAALDAEVAPFVERSPFDGEAVLSTPAPDRVDEALRALVRDGLITVHRSHRHG